MREKVKRVKFTCDKCEFSEIVDVAITSLLKRAKISKYSLPDGWEEREPKLFYARSGLPRDLCPTCSAEKEEE